MDTESVVSYLNTQRMNFKKGILLLENEESANQPEINHVNISII